MTAVRRITIYHLSGMRVEAAKRHHIDARLQSAGDQSRHDLELVGKAITRRILHDVIRLVGSGFDHRRVRHRLRLDAAHVLHVITCVFLLG